MSYHKLMMENNTMYTKKVFENVSDRNLSKGQPKILEYLYSNDGAVQKDIAKSCFIEQATVTSILARMEKEDLVIRKVDPHNRRFLYVYLTEKGKVEAKFVIYSFEKLEENALGGFSNEEKSQFLSYLKRVNENLKEC